MLVLVIRTDKPEAEIGLYNDNAKLGHVTWLAHRALAETLHIKIISLIDRCNKKLQDIEGIIVFEGPGSFTGLRIGIGAANALAYSYAIPVVGSTGEKWIEQGLQQLPKTQPHGLVMPAYGAPVHITAPKR